MLEQEVEVQISRATYKGKLIEINNEQKYVKLEKIKINNSDMGNKDAIIYFSVIKKLYKAPHL